MWDLERLKEWAKPALAHSELVTIARLTRSARQAKNLALVFATERGLEEEIAKACRWLMIIGRDHGRDVLEQYIKKESSEEMGKSKKLPTESSFIAIIRHIGEVPHILLAGNEDGQGLYLIGGRVEDGESATECGIREALKETGLNIAVAGQIDNDFNMIRDGEVTDIARVYYAACVGGILKITKENSGFRWVCHDDLNKAGIVERSCPGYPRGRTYAMVEAAIKPRAYDRHRVYSEIEDPEDLATCLGNTCYKCISIETIAHNKRLKIRQANCPHPKDKQKKNRPECPCNEYTCFCPSGLFLQCTLCWKWLE